MKELDTYGRFMDSVAKSKAKAGADDDGGESDNGSHPLLHSDPSKREAAHLALKAAHEFSFGGDAAKDESFHSAKARHAACVSLSDPANEKKGSK
jgi:hypothetical protein